MSCILLTCLPVASAQACGTCVLSPPQKNITSNHVHLYPTEFLAYLALLTHDSSCEGTTVTYLQLTRYLPVDYEIKELPDNQCVSTEDLVYDTEMPAGTVVLITLGSIFAASVCIFFVWCAIRYKPVLVTEDVPLREEPTSQMSRQRVFKSRRAMARA